MAGDWEQYSFHKILDVDPRADTDGIKSAHKALVSTLDPDTAPEEEKRAVALARLAADAALDALIDEESRKAFDARIDDVMKAASNKNKIETKRKGKLQEQQSMEEDEKLQKATEKFDSAISALSDFYYDRLFNRARKTRFDTITTENLMEWLGSERAESARASRQRGGRASFQIDWRGFAGVQDKRKERNEEIAQIVDGLVAKFQLP